MKLDQWSYAHSACRAAWCTSDKACLNAEGSLTRSESGNDRLRQEAENSRAEIWRKIQAAKGNNSQKQQVWFITALCSAVACSVPLPVA